MTIQFPTVTDYEVTLAFIHQNIPNIRDCANQYLNENFFEDDEVWYAYADRVDLNLIRDPETDTWSCLAYPVVNGEPNYNSQYEVPIVLDNGTYKVVRFYRDFSRDSKVVLTGLTLQEAKAHCRREDTKGDDWFDGYEKE